VLKLQAATSLSASGKIDHMNLSSIAVPLEHTAFARMYRWGFEAGFAGKPMPAPRTFGYAESFHAYKAGHQAGRLKAEADLALAAKSSSQ
jgi:hypothetical protein